MDDFQKRHLHKALQYIPHKTQELESFFQKPSDINLFSQLLQLMEYTANEQRTISFMHFIYEIFRKINYNQRSHIIKLLIYLPKKQITFEFLQRISIFFKQTATGPFRYDIFQAVQKIPIDQRCSILNLLMDILQEFESETWLSLPYRVHELLKVIHKIEPLKRPQILACLQKHPLILLHTDLFLAISSCCPALTSTAMYAE